MIIAIDGPAAGGKGTVALQLAEALGYEYVDTGAMYRAVALRALQAGIALDDEMSLGALAQHVDIRFVREQVGEGPRYRVLVDGEDVTAAIRQPDVERGSSVVAQFPSVRQALVEKQRALAAGGGVVMEGRDIGTVVLPDADVKFFVTASRAERARRRYAQYRGQGREVAITRIEAELAERDYRDSHRRVAPLRIPPDAIVIDTTDMTVQETVHAVRQIVLARLGKTHSRIPHPLPSSP